MSTEREKINGNPWPRKPEKVVSKTSLEVAPNWGKPKTEAGDSPLLSDKIHRGHVCAHDRMRNWDKSRNVADDNNTKPEKMHENDMNREVEMPKTGDCSASRDESTGNVDLTEIESNWSSPEKQWSRSFRRTSPGFGATFHDFSLKPRRRSGGQRTRGGKKVDISKIFCYNCHRNGHLSKNCPEKSETSVPPRNTNGFEGHSSGFGNEAYKSHFGAWSNRKPEGTASSRNAEAMKSNGPFYNHLRSRDPDSARKDSDKSVEDAFSRKLDEVYIDRKKDMDKEMKGRNYETDQHSDTNPRHFGFSSSGTNPSAKRVLAPPRNSLKATNVSSSLEESQDEMVSVGKNDLEFNINDNRNLLKDCDYQTIVTCRTITNSDGHECRERTVIKYPLNLPPNVQLITGHMLPSATL